MLESNMWIIYALIAATIVSIHLMCALAIQILNEESKQKDGFLLGLLLGVIGLIIAVIRVLIKRR